MGWIGLGPEKWTHVQLWYVSHRVAVDMDIQGGPKN